MCAWYILLRLDGTVIFWPAPACSVVISYIVYFIDMYLFIFCIACFLKEFLKEICYVKIACHSVKLFIIINIFSWRFLRLYWNKIVLSFVKMVYGAHILEVVCSFTSFSELKRCHELSFGFLKQRTAFLVRNWSQ